MRQCAPHKSRAVNDRLGSKAESAFFGLMSALAGCGHAGLRPFAALNARSTAAIPRRHLHLPEGAGGSPGPSCSVRRVGAFASCADWGVRFPGGCLLLRALLVNCDLHHSFEEASCASIMKTKQEHAHAWVWSAFV